MVFVSLKITGDGPCFFTYSVVLGPSTFTTKVSSSDKKRSMDKMPQLEDLVTLQPMKESQTMFGAFSNVKENGTRKIKTNPAHGDDG